jgi:glyoxylase-like metal-dependent hydrolase (beta-lactamase superfamily II)
MATAPAHLSPLPPVEQVRPGLWSVPVPIPNNPLRYVFVYAFETDAGTYIVDAGWNTDEAWDTLCAGLRQAGSDISSVRGVLVTHIHPDHYGLAARVREASGAWVGLHPEDAALIQDRYVDTDDLLRRMAVSLQWMGAPADEIDGLAHASMPVKHFVTTVRPDILIEDGDNPEVPGWDLTAIWTPGHSPGHLCFYEDRYRVMVSGDHVLPRITPNIPFHPQAGDDPLGAFLRSLDRLVPYASDEVLPAHEHRFVGLQGRLAELTAHHEHRFQEVTAALTEGRTTAWEVAECMEWSRPWSRISGFMRRAAVAEAMAHLRALERRGVIRCREADGEPARFELVG